MKCQKKRNMKSILSSKQLFNVFRQTTKFLTVINVYIFVIEVTSHLSVKK